MWILTVRSPNNKPREFLLKPEENTIGRRKDNDIVISEEAASRQHAQIYLDTRTNSVTVRDLGSKNGTFVNRRRLGEKHDFKLNPNDVLRIGSYELELDTKEEGETDSEIETLGFQPFSRDLLLESFDNHAVMLYEVIQKLNNVLDIDVALKEVSRLLRLTLGAEKCRVILAEDFERIEELGFPTTIARFAIEKRTSVLLPSKGAESKKLLSDSARLLKVHTALCVPVVSGEQTIALIYMYKTHSDTRNFDQRDMQLAIAVGHLAALTIERVSLMERVREEQRIRQLLQRFVAPTEVEFLLHKRVELNAFASDELVAWIEKKLEEHGVAKVVPDDENLADAYLRARRLAAVQARIDEVLTDIEDEDKDADEKATDDLRDEIQKRLKKDPKLPWDAVVREIAEADFLDDDDNEDGSE